MAKTHVYDFHDWAAIRSDAERLIYRPSGRTFGRRLGATLIAALAIGLMTWSFGFPPDSTVYWIVVVLCASVGVLVPLSGLWQKLTIEKDIRGDLCITQWGLLRRSHTFSQRGLADMCVVAGEVYHRQRRPRIEKFLGWRWQVQLRTETDQLGDDAMIVFWPDMTETLPPRMSTMTSRVREFVPVLERITGLSAGPPIRLRERVVSQGAFTTTRRMESVVEPTIRMSTSDGPPEGATVHKTTRTYTSLDEMPEDLRAEAEKLIAEARSADGSADGGVFRYRDSKGTEQVYGSLEEMPPEIRKRFEEIRRQSEQ